MASSAEMQSIKGPGIGAALAATIAWFIPGGQPAAAAASAAFLSTFAVSYGLQAWSMKEARKRSLEDVADRRVMIRSAVSPRRMIYGESLVSGPMIYAQVTGTDKEYLHAIVALAGHEIHSTAAVYLDSVAVGVLDGSGNVTTGDFNGLARFKFALGTASQAAFADLVSESGGKWTSAHQAKGTAMVYARLKFDQDKYPGGVPEIRVLVRGKKCYDPRDGVTRYTANPALVLRDYLTADYGLGCISAEIDDTAVVTAADVCDEWVALDAAVTISVTADATADTFTTAAVESRLQTGDQVVVTASSVPTGLTGGGTYYVIRTGPTVFQLASTAQNALEGTALGISSAGSGVVFGSIAQRRYAANGTATYDMAPKDVVDDIIDAMAGTLTWTGGRWRMTAGAYVAPTVTLDADDLRGPISFRNRVARHNLTNTIRGAYVEPARAWVQTDYAPVSNSTFVTQDGETIERAVDHAWITSAFRAQRLAKISLQKSRTKHLTMPCKIGALRLLAADTISVTIPQIGLSSATYRVNGWRLTGEDGGIGVDLDLEEESSAHYAWSASDGVTPPINTAPELPGVLNVVAPTSLTLASGNTELLAAADGSIISRMRITWGGAPETNLIGYEVQYRRGTDTAYISITAARDQTTTWAAPVEDGVSYDVRVRSIAAPGSRRSSWLTGTHTVVGKTAAPTAPSSLSVVAALGGFDIAWSASPDADYAWTELWEATSNDRATAIKLGNVAGNRYGRNGVAAAVDRWFWVRDVDTSGNVSTYYPASATAGITGTTLSAAGGIPTVTDASTITDTPGNPPPGGDAYWAVYSNADGKLWRWVSASGAYTKAADGADISAGSIAADRLAAANLGAIRADLGTVTAGNFSLNSSGYIRSGTVTWLSGTGIWMGFDTAAYKFRIGNPSGAQLAWDGTSLTFSGALSGATGTFSGALSAATGSFGNVTASGSVSVSTTGNIQGGQTAYNTGTGFWIGYSSGYKFSIGNPAGEYMRWTGSALEVNGSIVDTRVFAAGSTPVAAASTEVFMPGAALSYAKTKAITVPRAGVLRCTWDIYAGTTGSNTKSRIYKNGVALSSEFIDTAIGWASHSYDATVADGDSIELWTYWNSTQGKARNFVLKNTFNENFFVVTLDAY